MEEAKSGIESHCRFCNALLVHSFVDLGMLPLCEEYVAPENVKKKENFYPLHTFVCDKCFLVQVRESIPPDEVYSKYAYFSSYSESWLNHAENYVNKITEKLKLNSWSFVVELASNDGYLLQYFVKKGIRVLGIDPAANIAEHARKKGVNTEVLFFGIGTAIEIRDKYEKAGLIVGNNVLAHVPEINDFVAGMKILLKDTGVITMEFQHLLKLIENNQFDTIYHEHYSYLSLITVDSIFRKHGLRLFDVEELPTHGGSLRIYACHTGNNDLQTADRVNELREKEIDLGLTKLEFYNDFSNKTIQTKHKLLELLIKLKREGKSIAGYGAPGKGNTLLNYCGIRSDFIDYTVDRNPYKHSKFLPGTRIPIFPPEKIEETKPDYIFILPWNLKDEIIHQLHFVKKWGAKFIIPIPEPCIIE